MHYNIDQTNDTRTLDFHRFILFYRHEWTPEWSFNSEVELEHNLVKDGHGELELEQAYVDFHPGNVIGFRAGVVLAPIGIYNLLHEPPTFLSVERPDYAKVIIPTTWFGNGLTVYGHWKDFRYNLTVMEGLNRDGFSLGSGLRGGRQKGYKANADDLLKSFRVDYTGFDGATVGLSYSLNDAYRENQDPIGYNLFEIHARYENNGIHSSFEYANIQFDNYSIGPDETRVNSSGGYYIELGYNVSRLLDLNTKIIPWFRWTDYNTASETEPAAALDEEYHYQKWLAGVAIEPIESVSFKVDYGVKTNQLTNDETQLLNLGVGYMF